MSSIRSPLSREDIDVMRLLAVLAVAATATACSGGSSTDRATAHRARLGHRVVITGTDDLRFDPTRPQVRRGAVTIVLRNAGSYPHNISFPSLRRTSSSVTGAFGDTQTVLHLVVPRPGTYTFLCTYHDRAGMTGALVVR
jgi:plastocyanin